MKILVCGHNGQVAQALATQLAGLGAIHLLGRDQLDLARPQALREPLRQLAPDLIINAAAYTAVDQAESEPEAAYAINADAPRVLAEEALRLGAPLIHYSTDYVFDGCKATPYTEADRPNPLSIYGRSKLAGEQAIAAVDGEHLILRTSWVYSLHGRNFLLTMQRLLQEKPQLRVVDDQIGAPTWAASIATSTRALIERWQAGQAGAWGTYHLTAQGETSWFASPRPSPRSSRPAACPAPNCCRSPPASTRPPRTGHSTRAWTAHVWPANGTSTCRIGSRR